MVMKAPDENIENLLRVDRVVYPTPETKARSYIQDYESEYRRSIADPEAFWDKVARELDWFTPWQRVLDWKYPWAKWFVGATCNISYNCLDRHVKTWRRNKVAVIWVGEQGQERILTYGELFRQVNRCANALKALGLRKGDRLRSTCRRSPSRSWPCSPAPASGSSTAWCTRGSAPRRWKAASGTPSPVS